MQLIDRYRKRINVCLRLLVEEEMRGAWRLPRGIGNPLGMMDMFIISVVVMMAWPPPDAKVDQIVHTEYTP